MSHNKTKRREFQKAGSIQGKINMDLLSQRWRYKRLAEVNSKLITPNALPQYCYIQEAKF